jgi:hypothetical protein
MSGPRCREGWKLKIRDCAFGLTGQPERRGSPTFSVIHLDRAPAPAPRLETWLTSATSLQWATQSSRLTQ